MIDLAYIPSPSRGEWFLGPIPIRGYAFAIILGVIAAIWIAERRWVARGGRPGTAGDIALWAVPFGLIGGRLYHVLTDWQLYFGDGRDPWRALQIWQGGLGVRGAISLGAVGAWIGRRRAGIRLPPFADAAARHRGRSGDWTVRQLATRAARPTDRPALGLRIDEDHRLPGTRTSRPTTQRSSTRRCGASASQP